MATTRTLGGAFDEQAVALLALPADSGSRLPPHAPCLLQFLLELRVAAGVDVAWVAVGPFVEFGGLPGALCASHVAALIADGGRGRDEHVVALVAGAADALRSLLVDQLATRLGLEGEKLLLLLLGFGGVGGSIGFGGLGQLFGGRLLLGVAGALFAALVLAVGADLVGAVGGSAVVAGAVDAHADGLLDSLDADGLGGGGDPFVRLEGQTIFGEECAGSLVLESTAVQFLGDDGLWIGLSLVISGSGSGSSSSGGTNLN